MQEHTLAKHFTGFWQEWFSVLWKLWSQHFIHPFFFLYKQKLQSQTVSQDMVFFFFSVLDSKAECFFNVYQAANSSNKEKSVLRYSNNQEHSLEYLCILQNTWHKNKHQQQPQLLISFSVIAVFKKQFHCTITITWTSPGSVLKPVLPFITLHNSSYLWDVALLKIVNILPGK